MFRALLIALFLGVTQLAIGNICPGSIAFKGEFLYFRPTIDQSYYAISSSDNFAEENFFPAGKRFNTDPGFHPAFRLEGIYALCNCVHFIDSRFTYFNGGGSDSINGEFLFDTIGFPGNGAQAPQDTAYAGTAMLKESFRYYAADVVFRSFILNCCPEGLSFLVGIHYAYIQSDEHFNSFGISIEEEQPISINNHLSRKSHFWGIGPEFGLDYRYQFPQCKLGAFSLLANARASLLCSHTKASFHYDSLRTGSTGVDLHNQPLWRATPAVDTRLGLVYDFLCTRIEVGYELLWYSNSIDSIVGYDIVYAGDSIDAFSSLSLQGPYVAISFGF